MPEYLCSPVTWNAKRARIVSSGYVSVTLINSRESIYIITYLCENCVDDFNEAHTYRCHTSSCTGYKFIRILDILVGRYQCADVLIPRIPKTKRKTEGNHTEISLIKEMYKYCGEHCGFCNVMGASCVCVIAIPDSQLHHSFFPLLLMTYSFIEFESGELCGRIWKYSHHLRTIAFV